MSTTTTTTFQSPITIIPSLTSTLSTPLIALLALLTPYILYRTYTSYQLFLSLGPGGPPYNFYGFLQITLLGTLRLRNPLSLTNLPLSLASPTYLSPLLPRSSTRPNVIGIAPHRQTTQKASIEIMALLQRKIKGLAGEYPGELGIGVSAFEKHCRYALFSRVERNRTKKGEVCHVHGFDGSAHVTLAGGDVEEVLKKGWGERHPLARGGFCERFVPVGFTMIYAPRNEEEVEVVMEIIKAAVCWVRDERVFDEDVQKKIEAESVEGSLGEESCEVKLVDVKEVKKPGEEVKVCCSVTVD